MEKRQIWIDYFRSDAFKVFADFLYNHEKHVYTELLSGNPTAVVRLQGIDELRCELERIADYVGTLNSGAGSLFAGRTIATAGSEPVAGAHRSVDEEEARS